MDFTGPQVWRGLAGFHLISDDVEDDPRPARRRAGRTADDHGPLVRSGRLVPYPSLDPRLLDTPGVREPYVGRGARRRDLGQRTAVAGAGGGRRPLPVPDPQRLQRAPLPARARPGTEPGAGRSSRSAPTVGCSPHRFGTTPIAVAPAERFDVVVDFSAVPGRHRGDPDQRSRAGQHGRGDAVPGHASRSATTSVIPDRLAEVEPLRPGPNAPVREWRFSRGGAGGPAHWVINGRAFDPERMDARPRLGQTEIWRFSSDLHHPVHVHLSPFQVLPARHPGSGALRRRLEGHRRS